MARYCTLPTQYTCTHTCKSKKSLRTKHFYGFFLLFCSSFYFSSSCFLMPALFSFAFGYFEKKKQKKNKELQADGSLPNLLLWVFFFCFAFCFGVSSFSLLLRLYFCLCNILDILYIVLKLNWVGRRRSQAKERKMVPISFYCSNIICPSDTFSSFLLKTQAHWN